MNTFSSAQAPLPVYTAEELAGLDLEGLLVLLIRNEDRVPRPLIDECARRGEAMVERFATLVDPDGFWKDDAASGEWWLRLHVMMILGLNSGERAGLLLVALMRRMEQAGDENLQGWFSGYWPALFRNKPHAVETPLRGVAQDRGIDWYMRAQAIDSVVALGERRGVEALDASLDWMASIAADESEDWDLRLAAGNNPARFSARATPRAVGKPGGAAVRLGRPFLRNGCGGSVFASGGHAGVAWPFQRPLEFLRARSDRQAAEAVGGRRRQPSCQGSVQGSGGALCAPGA